MDPISLAPVPNASLVLDAGAIERALKRIAHEIIEANPVLEQVALIGIPSRGIEIAKRLAAFIQQFQGTAIETGAVDISMHRDDLRSRGGLQPVMRTALPSDLRGKTLVLADDVLFSGRTCRAALDAISSFGRPDRIQLAVLIDRGHRELPIRADYVGKNIPSAYAQRVFVRFQSVDGSPDAVWIQQGGSDQMTPPAPPPDERSGGEKSAHFWTRKDLCGIRELEAREIVSILDTASAFKTVGARDIKKVPALRGKTMVNFFVEPSTRTRTSFEIAAHRLSADVINISAGTSSLTKGETLKDTALNLEALYADIIVLRHSSAGAAQFLAERLRSSVVNAGDGAHEHPTQALLDCLTIRERLGRIEGLHVAIIGDILFSRVARSNIHALTKLGARVTLVGPSTLAPRTFEKLGVEVSHRLDTVLPTADVINLLRIQHERQRKEYFPSLGEYTALFGVTKQRAALLKPGCLIMHPGPINRGVEIDSEIADSAASVILDQVTNGLAVRMAVLYLCAGAQASSRGSG